MEGFFTGERMNYIIKEILGSKMCLFPDDPLSQALIRDGIREPEATAVMQKILKPDWTVIEIGANLGYYALMEAKVVKQVYAIEPILKNMEALKKSIELNGYKNIKTYQLAIGPSNGEFDILVSRSSNISTMMADKMSVGVRNWFKSYSIGTEKIKTLTLDSFIENLKIDKVDLVRMDIEGYEIEAVKGMQNTLKNMSKGSYLFIEFHPTFFSDKTEMLETVDNIYSHGFKTVNIDGDLKHIIKNVNLAPDTIFQKTR